MILFLLLFESMKSSDKILVTSCFEIPSGLRVIFILGQWRRKCNGLRFSVSVA